MKFLRNVIGILVLGLSLAPVYANPSPPNRPSLEELKRNLLRDNKTAAKNLRAVDVSKAQVILYSLNPKGNEDFQPNTSTVFHGFPILGQAEIIDARDKAAMLTALASGIEKSDGTVAACFDPRHGLRVTTPSGELDLSICFECLQVYTFPGAQRVTTTRKPSKSYNSLLEKYHLPRAKE